MPLLRHIRRIFLRVALLAGVLAMLPSCTTLSYYGQSVTGHLNLMTRAEPIDAVLARKDLPETTRARLQLAGRIRAFAVGEMGLPDNGSYTSYADTGRDYVVWNVVAAEEFSVFPKRWCFAFVGCLSYRGYYDKHDADAEAKLFANQGMDVHVSGARAYSTLGWFKDPLTTTILEQSEAELVYVLNHELAHQRLYLDNDSAFNESFATAVGNEAVRRWYERQGDTTTYDAYITAQARRADFYRLLIDTRRRLAALYDQSLPDAEKRTRKAAVFAELKGPRYAAFKARWNGYGGYDRWMAQDLNNARLSLVATYQQHVPAFQALLAQHAGDLQAFYAAAERLGGLQRPDRSARLAGLAGGAVAAVDP